jgi:hypothetical protein
MISMNLMILSNPIPGDMFTGARELLAALERRLPADQRVIIETWLEGDLSKWRLENLRVSSHPTAHLMQGRCSWLFRLIFLSLIGTESQKFALNFVPDKPRGIRPGSPAPISIAVAHLPLRASGSDE